MKMFWFVYSLLMLMAKGERTILHANTNKPIFFLLPASSCVRYTQVSTIIKSNSPYSFISLQIHSQSHLVVSSFTPVSNYGYERNGTDSGIIKMIYNNIFETEVNSFIGVVACQPVKSMFLVVPSEVSAPIPGACCLTCSLEIDPNIYIKYNGLQATITFGRANRYSPLGTISCDDSETPESYALTYDVYYYYLPYNDYTNQSLFDGIIKMSTVRQVKKYGLHLRNIVNGENLNFNVQMVHGQGVIFNVIVSDSNFPSKSVYVPTATYACNYTSFDRDCKSRGPLYVLILFIILAVPGCILCVAGFRLFPLLLFTCGSLLWWILIYLIITNTVHSPKMQDTVLISAITSLVGGGLFLFFYASKKFIYLSLLFIVVILGGFLSAIVFYTPFGFMEIWDSVLNFGIGYVCLTLAIALVCLLFPKMSCYACSSILGSYAIILIPNYFLRSSMQQVILNVMLHFTVSDFGTTYLRRPFQSVDFILIGIWCFIFITSFIIQYCTTKNRPFEISGNEMRQKAWDKLSESLKFSRKRLSRRNIRNFSPTANERTPLLHEVQSSPTNFYNINSNHDDGDDDINTHTAIVHAQPLGISSIEQQPPSAVNPYWQGTMSSFYPAPPPYEPTTKII